jgi:hypothetical protein
MKYKLHLTAWYLNPERICQLINSKALAQHLAALGTHSGIAHILSSAGVARSIIKQELESWLHVNEVPSLGELIARGRRLQPGDLFTTYQDFYGKGLRKYRDATRGLPRDATAELHNSLPLESGKRIRVVYSPGNLTTATAWSRLSGHTRLFCFCYAEADSEQEVLAHPYLIGDAHTGLELSTPESWDGRNYGEIDIASIDQFALIRDVRQVESRAPDLTTMKNISEAELKQALGEILHESDVPKDWGGEKSDLFSTNVSISSRYIPAAFLLKGPAAFSEMKLTHLGKNGDQLVRLFSEPADLLILQHCHKVSTAVRSTMRAFASRVHDLRYFSILDGYDTVRLLEVYGKCGL